MIPKLAIEKAIEGGWQHWEYVGQPEESFTDILALNENDQALIVVDPTFWQALGKSLGWGSNTKNIKLVELNREKLAYLNAHRFVELVLTNKSTEGFWQELLS